MTLTIDDDVILSSLDKDALERAIDICRTKTAAGREQIEDMLATDPWFEAATFAAYSCQMDSLDLKPWQSPPCWIDDVVGDINAGNDGIGGQYAAAKLLRRMLDLGISRFEPDPLARLKGRPPDRPPPTPRRQPA